MAEVTKKTQSEKVTFWTQPSHFARREWPHRTLKHPYNLIGIIEVQGEFYHAHQRSALPEELLLPDDMDQTILELPTYLLKGILVYFQKYIGSRDAVDFLNRTCHHFARTLYDPATGPYRSECSDDIASQTAQAIVQENLVHTTDLPLGWWGVYGERRPEKGDYIPYHSVIGLGEGKPNISVMALRGSMGLCDYRRMHENMVHDISLQMKDPRRGEAVKLYASPYFQAYDPDKIIKPANASIVSKVYMGR